MSNTGKRSRLCGSTHLRGSESSEWGTAFPFSSFRHCGLQCLQVLDQIILLLLSQLLLGIFSVNLGTLRGFAECADFLTKCHVSSVRENPGHPFCLTEKIALPRTFSFLAANRPFTLPLFKIAASA
jgi:hypothetical protein